MKKSRRAAGVKQSRSKSVELFLPEEIIQHIQSFMDAREAAHSSLLSKSWHRAWSTRPILSLDQFLFTKKRFFRRFAKKTMQRYEDLNLRIRRFTLDIDSRSSRSRSLLADLISKALKLGATDLRIQNRGYFDIPYLDIPDELLLQSKTLDHLRVYGGRIRGQKKFVTSCSNLRSLELGNLDVNPDVIGDLISGCPLIEELALEGGLQNRTPFDVATLIKLPKLRYLKLLTLNFGDSLCKSVDLWPNLACLKELEILDVTKSVLEHRHTVVRICSASLERIQIRTLESACLRMGESESYEWEFDVPSLTTFGYEGHTLPQIKLETSMNVDIDMDLSMGSREARRASWFGSLNELVKMCQCHGRVSLSMLLYISASPSCGGGYVGDGSAIPALENLTLWDGGAVNPDVLEALFWTCRPNFVKIERCLLRGIKEEDVQVFQQLKALPWKTWKTLLDDSQQRFIRFQLK